ncbi:MAG: Na/Pi cotransporter family protein [Defluviitaleaceae bacterium]|nr:Na/Pi cotransporter family protein [Defluviitaleaceae bacterium]
MNSDLLFGGLKLLGGLGLFLYGMTLMAEAMKKMAGGKLQSILEKLTNNPIKALLLGTGVTAIIQSSSATTVIVVGFVNSGIMKLGQVAGIILGANIGTTVTAWMLSLTGIEEGSNIAMQMLRPANFSLLFAIIGAVLVMFFKGKKPIVGQVLLGLAILFTGMGMMSGATAPLRDSPTFASFVLIFENPFLGVLLGFALTAIVQSSSAALGILTALAISTDIPFSVVLPIILGENIGTCVTALLSSIGASINGKRAAVLHLLFKVVATFITIPVVYAYQYFVGFNNWLDPVTGTTIAFIHSSFNVTFAFLFLPFTAFFVRLVEFLVKDKKAADSEDETLVLTKMLDERFLSTPAMALEQSKNAIYIMANIAAKNVKLAAGQMDEFSAENQQMLLENEGKLNVLAENISNYLIKIKSPPVRENKVMSKYLHCIRDLERIGDHAENITAAFAHMKDNNIEFSKASRAEVEILIKAVNDILEATVGLFNDYDLRSAERIEPLEEVIDFLRDNFKERQIARLKENVCTIESGVVYNDIITDLERIADHCSNIAQYIIEELYERDGVEFVLHEYTRRVVESYEFMKQYDEHKEKYLNMLELQEWRRKAEKEEVMA